MTFLQIRHFIVLAQLGSFAKASKALFITQPALSRSIKSLEDELGQMLFDRIGRKIELTSFGISSLKRSKELLESLDELKGSGKTKQPITSGVYKLGLSSGPGALLSAALLTKVANQFSKVRVEIFRANTQTLVGLLKEREVDALVVDLRSLAPDSALHIEHIYEFAGEFLCRKSHPLLKLRKVSYEQLIQYPIASTPLSDELARLLISRYGDTAHPKEMIRLISDEINDLIHVAKTSDTVVLAARAAGRGLEVLRVLPPLNASAKYAVVVMKNRSQAVLHSTISELIDQILKTDSSN